MSRIWLTRNLKYKKIILLILVLISAGILIYEFSNNIKNKNNSIEINNDGTEYISGSSQSEDNNDSDKFSSEDKSTDKNSDNTISDRERELYNSAYTTFFSGDYEAAVSKGDEIIKEFPESYMGYNIRGIAKAYNGDFNGGMSDIDKSLSINSDYGYGRFNKALTYELYSQFDSALEWYNKALEIEDYVWTYYGIASIYGRRGDVSNTVEYLKKAVDIDSTVKENARTESDFDPVRNSEEFKELIE